MKKITLLIIVFMTMPTFCTQAQETEIVLTQSTDEVFVPGSVSCGGGDNSWYREYVLLDEEITKDVNLVGIQFGLEANGGDEELEIYAYSFTGFPSGFNSSAPPTPIASGSITVGTSDVGTIIRANFDAPALVSAGASVVLRIVQPTISGNQLFLGSTTQETKPSFLSSTKCGIAAEPESFNALGYPSSRPMINLIVVEETLSLHAKLIENLALYPNPTNGNIKLKIPSGIEVWSVGLFDVLGKKVNVLFQNQMLFTEKLSKGVYVLHLETSKGGVTRKIVKQ